MSERAYHYFIFSNVMLLKLNASSNPFNVIAYATPRSDQFERSKISTRSVCVKKRSGKSEHRSFVSPGRESPSLPTRDKRKSFRSVTPRVRAQIVIQVGEEVDGVAMVRCAADVRSADHTGEQGDVIYKETLCPLKYLQEV